MGAAAIYYRTTAGAPVGFQPPQPQRLLGRWQSRTGDMTLDGNGQVVAVADSSGSAHPLTGSSGVQPQGAFPYLYFDGDDSFLADNGFSMPTGSYAYLLNLKNLLRTAGNQIIIGNAAGNHAVYFGESGASLIFYQGNQGVALAAPAEGEKFALGVGYNAATQTATLYLNGVLVNTLANVPPNNSMGAAERVLNIGNAGGGLLLRNALLGEIAVYGGTSLSDAEHAAWAAYLATR